MIWILLNIANNVNANLKIRFFFILYYSRSYKKNAIKFIKLFFFLILIILQKSNIKTMAGSRFKVWTLIAYYIHLFDFEILNHSQLIIGKDEKKKEP